MARAPVRVVGGEDPPLAGRPAVRRVSLITTFGVPQDVTVQEPRLEAFPPADEEIERLIRAVVGGAEDDPQG